ncbi:MAG: hypothetical protein JSV59_05440 [Flavobacteriaceae bacterium]|nr:MAG: hypothetical protein JSV59_05440 [Flavobacteriaceae bacterium]
MNKGLIPVIITILLISCKSVGPKTLPADQFDFNTSISDASNEQLLLNLIRLRYNEPPVFLKVSSVINQYTRAGGVDARAGLNNAIPTGANSATVGANYAWSNTPTITYIPISGREFSTNLLVPLPPASLLGMIQAGWPIDLVLDLTIFSINGIKDDISRPSARREATNEFFELLELWNKLNRAGILGTRKEDKEVLFFQKNFQEEYEEDVTQFKKLLSLEPELNEFTISYGVIQKSSSEISILSGSIWEIMLNLAWKFGVPEEHIESGRTKVAFRPAYRNYVPPLNIRYSKEKPERKFISVFLHDYWFYIDVDDMRTKRNFSFLQLLLNLAENTANLQAPVVTVPTN